MQSNALLMDVSQNKKCEPAILMTAFISKKRDKDNMIVQGKKEDTTIFHHAPFVS